MANRFSKSPGSGRRITFEPLESRQLLASAASAHIDAAGVRDELIRFVDTWNGGESRQRGTSAASGTSAYASTWDGLFRTNVDQQFNRIHYYTDDQTIIS